MKISLKIIVLAFFMPFFAFSHSVLMKKMGDKLFQYHPNTNNLIVNSDNFSSNEPFFLQLDASEFKRNYLSIPFDKGAVIYVNNKLYKKSISGTVEMIPISNLKRFAGSNQLLVSFLRFDKARLKNGIELVVFSEQFIDNKVLRENDLPTLTIPKSIHAHHHFNQFAFMILLIVSAVASQSLFARKTVFVGAAAIRQSRYRSMDDNLKLFGFNVLVFTCLFTGFSFIKVDVETHVFTVFFKNFFLVVLFFGVKILVNGVSKRIFFDSNALSFYANNYLHITAVFGIALASIFYFEAFIYYPFPSIPISVYLIMFILAELTYVISFAFMNYELSRYKLFYIISYICAFEGIPLLILAKYLFQTGIISS